MTADRTAALLALAEALPAGTAVPVPREWLLDLLTGSEAQPATATLPLADLTVGQLAERFGRKACTARGWCERGQLPGAYRWKGTREWRIPLASVLAFEQAERERQAGASRETPQLAGGRRKSADLSAWRRVS